MINRNACQELAIPVVVGARSYSDSVLEDSMEDHNSFLEKVDTET